MRKPVLFHIASNLGKTEPLHEKTCLMPYANNKGADPRSLISAFVVRCLDSIIRILSISRFSKL